LTVSHQAGEQERDKEFHSGIIVRKCLKVNLFGSKIWPLNRLRSRF
jgi:hypothetical protein